MNRRDFLEIVAAALAAPLVEPALQSSPVEDSGIWLQPYMYLLSPFAPAIVTDRHFLLNSIGAVAIQHQSRVRIVVNKQDLFDGPAGALAFAGTFMVLVPVHIEPNSTLELFSDDLDLRLALKGVRAFKRSELPPPGEIDAEFDDEDEEDQDEEDD